jgi:hypothetical protein
MEDGIRTLLTGTAAQRTQAALNFVALARPWPLSSQGSSEGTHTRSGEQLGASRGSQISD